MKLKDILNEGTWSVPQTYEQAVQLKKLMSKPLRLGDAKDLLYNLVGDDELFDTLDNAIERGDELQLDVRGYVARKLAQWVKSFDQMEWRNEWEPRAFKEIQSIVKQYGHR